MSDLERAAAKMFCVGFDGTAVTSNVRRLIGRGISGVTLFGRNIQSAQQVAELNAELKAVAGRPFLICTDQEGGRVMRLREGFTDVPAMRAVGQAGDEPLAREVGRLLARELRAVNIDVDFAPVLDVDTNPANPVIGHRSLGPDPTLVARLGRAIFEGLQEQGVAACAKHFPGHGDTSQDSHLHLPRLPHAMERLEAVELLPFRAAMGAVGQPPAEKGEPARQSSRSIQASEGSPTIPGIHTSQDMHTNPGIQPGVAMIMSAHVVFEALDSVYLATMSRAVLDGLLRKQMGFEGVIISDALEMKAIAAHFRVEEVVTRGANAGIDLFAPCEESDLRDRAIDALIHAVERGEVPRERLDEAGRRIDALAGRYAKPPVDPSARAVIGCAKHRAVLDRIRELAKDTSEGMVDPTAHRLV